MSKLSDSNATKMRAAEANIEKQPLRVFTEKAYLDYSMYVILDRALPHIGDGLKPVQRRIMYAMSELALKASAKFKKSARTVGDVLGKYHPHGDTACYEAMVLMAQPFSYRYPLVDGQGNWGSADDPKSFAAMRYTESRMSPYTELLLHELEQGTVDWMPNFDGTLEEPTLLPARLPNILLNGAMGIAVGMSTDIPSHNLREVANACVYLLDNDQATLEDVCCYVKAPDFPTAAEIITPAHEILETYRKGIGSLRLRAVYSYEDGEIIITALPYQVSGSKVQEQIAAQMQAKKLPLVADLRDESDHENPTRIVIVPRSNRVDVEVLMAHLFATTDLERSYRINLNMIGIDGRPQVKNLLAILKEWLEFRKLTVRRRLQYRLDKILERLHILQGLMIAYLNLDQVIHIIRTEDKPKEALMMQFKLSEIQANAILDLKLRHLAKLEEFKIRGEQEELQKECDGIEQILGSEARLKALIRQELIADAAKYGDERRSALVVRSEAKAMREEEILPTELVTIIMSQQGWVRVAKGHDVNPEELSYKAGDGFKMKACGRSNQMAVFLDSTGRSYSVPVHKLPSARGHGEPLTSHFEIPAAATFEAVLLDKPEQSYIFASDAGYGFVAKLEDLYAKNKAGKAFLSLPEGAKVLLPCQVMNMEEQYLISVTNMGNMLIFPVACLPVLPRGKGNKIIGIPSDLFKKRQDYLASLAVMHENEALILWSGARDLSLRGKDLAGYHGERGRRGSKLPRAFRKLDKIEVSEIKVIDQRVMA